MERYRRVARSKSTRPSLVTRGLSVESSAIPPVRPTLTNCVETSPGVSNNPSPATSRSCRYTCRGDDDETPGANVVDHERNAMNRPSALIEG